LKSDKNRVTVWGREEPINIYPNGGKGHIAALER